MKMHESSAQRQKDRRQAEPQEQEVHPAELPALCLHGLAEDSCVECLRKSMREGEMEGARVMQALRQAEQALKLERLRVLELQRTSQDSASHGRTNEMLLRALTYTTRYCASVEKVLLLARDTLAASGSLQVVAAIDEVLREGKTPDKASS